MNLRAYFQKIRDVEASIAEDIVMVVSLGGDDNGLPGIMTEVTRAAAAKLIVEQKSRLATRDEAEAHQASQEAARKQIAEEMAAQRLQVTILSGSQVEGVRRSRKKD